MKRKLFAALFAALSVTYVSQAQELLSTKDYMDYEWTSNPQISPNGKEILYTRTWINAVDDKRERDLWIVNVDGSNNRFFLNGNNGAWSPNGNRVAFVKEGEPKGSQIFVKFIGVEGEPTQITRLENNPSNMKWSPDGKYIAFTSFVDQKEFWKIDLPAKPEGAKWTKAPRIVEKPVYRRDRRGYNEQGYTHIFIVPAEGGTARQITSGDWNHGGSFDWTPDGSSIVFNSLRVPDPEYVYRESQLYSVNVRSGEITQLTERKGNEYSPVISPDGKKVAFIGTEWTENFYHAQNLYVMDLASKKVQLLTDNLDRRLNGLQWANDNSGVYFNVDDQGNRNMHFASTSGKWKKVSKGNHMLTASSMSNSGLAVGVRTSHNSPPDIVTVDKNGSVNQITNVNSDILDFKQLGSAEEVRYKSKDGTEIQGWLIKPPNFDPEKKYPLILRIHGGPHAMYNVGFNFTYQLHAAEGYVILYTNPRGSTGYGYEFANAIQNNYPGEDYDDLMAGVDEIIKRGYIDENKLYVYGGSGGGVLTSWIVGHTDRFAASSVNYPVINWISFVGTTDGIGWYKNFEKYPWEDMQEHWDRSPLKYVGNVKTPTMLMTGVKDLRTPISQTEEFYQALQVQKVPSVMIRFNDEYHGTGSNPSNFMRTVSYLHHWFGKWEKNDMSVSVETVNK